MTKKWAIASVALIFAGIAQSARADDTALCLGIAGQAGSLLDRSDSEVFRQSVDYDFQHVCSDTSRYKSNLSNSNSDTQMSFGYAGYSLGFGNSASDANATSDQAIDKVCRDGKKYVQSYYSSVNKKISGQYAVSLVSHCLDVLTSAQLEALSGTTEVSDSSDTAFFVHLQFKPSASAPDRKYTLIDISYDQTAQLDCKKDGVDVRKNLIVSAQSQITFTCTKAPGTSVNGAFNFAVDKSSPVVRSLNFKVPSLSGNEKIREEIKQQIEDEINRKVQEVREIAVPRGGIVAFSDPNGCVKLGKGWADAGLGGKFLVGATSGDNAKWPVNTEGGAETYTLQAGDIPAAKLNLARGLSGGASGAGLNFNSYFDTVKFDPSASNPIKILPPFKALYFCTRVE
jgi:hypothetical protein